MYRPANYSSSYLKTKQANYFTFQPLSSNELTQMGDV